jgi:acetyltransferase
MSTAYLERLFRPRSVAVIGANDKPQRVGGVIMRNLLSGGFEGPIMPVNPRHDSVAGVLTYPDVSSLPRTPDVAILCTPPETVPDLVDELGSRGTRAAVVVARGLATAFDASGHSLQERMLAAARAHGMRLLGGSTLGLLVPRIGLDASFSRVRALPGEIGFVSQSDAMGTLVLDWAAPRRIGFSHFISLGDAADVGFGEALDYLGSDPDTRAILLYIESLRERRRFMAAARGAARNKPVLAIKAGRRPPGRPGERAPVSADTLSLVEPDAILDAALRRAGILRVERLEELFSAVGTLARARLRRGERLAVVSNGGGAGVMAADELYAGGLRLADLSEVTTARLRAALPPGWDGTNPIDIQVDAPGARYAEVLRILVESGELDALLAIHTPSALASSTDAARAVIQAAAGQPCSLLTCWMGGETLAAARKLLAEAGLATFDTPADAVRAFRFTVTYQRNREALIQTPPSVAAEFQPDTASARRVIERALQEGRDFLRAPERMAVLAAYGIPVAEAHIAESPERAAAIAREVGFPVELAIRSPDVRRKREVGGVALSLETPEAVEAAARNLVSHLSVWRPDARLTGFTVQRMIPRPHGRPLFVGAAVDPLFGPVILFGEGRASERYRGLAVGLPPLNVPLARELISRARMDWLLEASPTRPAADLEALALALVKVSQMVVDLPEIVEMDVNPLLADERGVIAIDAFMRVAVGAAAEDRLAIRPYPQGLEERVRLADGQELVLRPVRPEDEPGHDDFIARLSPEDSRFRFFHYVRSLPHSELARLTQIDYDREMAFIAVLPGPGGETLGVVRSVADPDNDTAEFSVVVRTDQKRRGIGRLLLAKLIAYGRSRGTRRIAGDVLGDKAPMLALARRMGGRAGEPGPDGVVRVTFPLRGEGDPGAPG